MLARLGCCWWFGLVVVYISQVLLGFGLRVWVFDLGVCWLMWVFVFQGLLTWVVCCVQIVLILVWVYDLIDWYFECLVFLLVFCGLMKRCGFVLGWVAVGWLSFSFGLLLLCGGLVALIFLFLFGCFTLVLSFCWVGMFGLDGFDFWFCVWCLLLGVVIDC